MLFNRCNKEFQKGICISLGGKLLYLRDFLMWNHYLFSVQWIGPSTFTWSYHMHRRRIFGKNGQESGFEGGLRPNFCIGYMGHFRFQGGSSPPSPPGFGAYDHMCGSYCGHWCDYHIGWNVSPSIQHFPNGRYLRGFWLGH